MVTLWVDPKAEQIRRYRADGFDWSFLPGSSIVQFEEIHGSMDMSEAFPGVWLPDAIEMRFGLVTALGKFGGRYEVRYHDYRLAEVTSTIRPAGPEPRRTASEASSAEPDSSHCSAPSSAPPPPWLR